MKSTKKSPKYLIAPSILAADFARLGEEIEAVSCADIIHIDVMDNHYVPNLTIGPMVCAALRKYGITMPLDVHLMTKPVDSLVLPFAKAGANYITFHPEATEHIDRTASLIREAGCKVGLAFNPTTPLDYLDYMIDKIDLILIMSVNPGFGGQSFIYEMFDKIRKARALIKKSSKKSKKGKKSKKSKKIDLSVDGGVSEANIAKIAKAGANIFVAGSAIFGTKDYPAAIRNLRAKL